MCPLSSMNSSINSGGYIMISYRKELPISAEVDVVVAGAGSAGVAG